MESLQDQIEYGRHCMHGTNIGTPGGADLMCGNCEMGWTWWVDSARYGLFIETVASGLTSGAVVEWSDPLEADDDYIARAWSRIAEWAAMAEGHDELRLIVRQTRSGYWDEVPGDSASHQAAGHTLPEAGREGYCLTCYHDLDDIESWTQRVLRLAAERRDTIRDIRASDMLTDDELEGYDDETWTLMSMVSALRSGYTEADLEDAFLAYALGLIWQEDENIASYR